MATGTKRLRYLNMYTHAYYYISIHIKHPCVHMSHCRFDTCTQRCPSFGGGAEFTKNFKEYSLHLYLKNICVWRPGALLRWADIYLYLQMNWNITWMYK
jgi:hypothetical protein